MSEREIYKAWKGSKYPKTQLKILADLNNTNPKVIHEIVLRQQFLEKIGSTDIEDAVAIERVKGKNTKIEENVENTQNEALCGEEIAAQLDILEALILKYTKEYTILAHKLCGIGAEPCQIQ